MGRVTRAAAFSAWMALLAALFIHYQFGPFIIDNPAPGYLAASLKVLAMMLAAAAFGLRVLGAQASLPGVVRGLAVGLAALAVLGLILALLGVLKPAVVYLAVAALAAFSYREVAAMARAVRGVRISPLSPMEAGFSCVAAAALAVGLINCLSPVTANDALVYHLNLPRIYCDAAGMVNLPFNVYANMPHYGELLYSVFYSVAGETGVALFYFAVLIAAALAVYVLAAGRSSRLFGMVAAVAFLVQPLVLDHRVVANIDIPLAFAYMASLGLVLEGDFRGAARRTLSALGLLAGFMLGMKYTAVAPAVSLLILLLALRRRELRAPALVLAVAVSAAVFAPWVVRQGVNTGNPVYPLLEGRFDGANWDAVQQARLMGWQKSMGMGRSIAGCLALPFNVSTRGRPGLNYARFDGTISPVFLMLLPLILLNRRRREDLALTLTLLGLGLFWALTSQQLRFLLPALALAAVLGARGLASVRSGDGGVPREAGEAGSGARQVRPDGLVRLALILVLFVQVCALAAPNQYGRPWVGDAVGERLGAVLGFEPRDRFLERTVQPYSLYSQADTALPAREPVFMVWENRAYHLGRPYFSDSFFEASTLMGIVRDARDAGELRDTIAGMGYRYVIVNDLLGEVFARQYGREEVMRLREFIEEYLEPVHSANRVTLYRMSRG